MDKTRHAAAGNENRFIKAFGERDTNAQMTHEAPGGPRSRLPACPVFWSDRRVQEFHSASVMQIAPVCAVPSERVQTSEPTLVSNMAPGAAQMETVLTPLEQTMLAQALSDAAGGNVMPYQYESPALPDEVLALFNASSFVPIVLPSSPMHSALAHGLPQWLPRLPIRRLKIAEQAPATGRHSIQLAQRLELLHRLLNALSVHPDAATMHVAVDIDLAFETSTGESDAACTKAMIRLLESFATDQVVIDLRASGFHMSVDVLLDALASNQHLRRLDLRGNVLIPWSVRLLCNLLEKNKHIRSLDLSGIGLWQRSIETVVGALKNNVGLQSVNLRGNRVLAEEQGQLRQLMRQRLDLHVEFDEGGSPTA